MDVSREYLSKLKKKDLSLFKTIYSLIILLYKLGKIIELTSFLYWECLYRSGLYKRRLINFSNQDAFVLTSNSLDDVNEISTEFLLKHEIRLRKSDIDWKFCVKVNAFKIIGVTFSHPNIISVYDNISIKVTHTFSYNVESIFINKNGTLFICSNGILYRSKNEGIYFEKSLSFKSTISYFLFNNGMTETPDGTLIIGEYGSIWEKEKWKSIANVYTSTDEEKSWKLDDFLLKNGVNKHVHIVKYSKIFNSIFLTDGDNKKQLWMKKFTSEEKTSKYKSNYKWRLITKYHLKTGGYLCMVDGDKEVLFGSDYLGGTNFIIKLNYRNTLTKQVLPNPYRRSPIMNLVRTQFDKKSLIWAFTYSCLNSENHSLLMCSSDEGLTWFKIIEFNGMLNEVRLSSSFHEQNDEIYISIINYHENKSKHKNFCFKISAYDTN